MGEWNPKQHTGKMRGAEEGYSSLLQAGIQAQRVQCPAQTAWDLLAHAHLFPCQDPEAFEPPACHCKGSFLGWAAPALLPVEFTRLLSIPLASSPVPGVGWNSHFSVSLWLPAGPRGWFQPSPLSTMLSLDIQPVFLPPLLCGL